MYHPVPLAVNKNLVVATHTFVFRNHGANTSFQVEYDGAITTTTAIVEGSNHPDAHNQDNTAVNWIDKSAVAALANAAASATNIEVTGAYNMAYLRIRLVVSVEGAVSIFAVTK